MKSSKKISLTALLLAPALYSLGAGFQVQEQGASNMGTAMAGAVTNANNDATAAFANPSALSFLNKGDKNTVISISGAAVLPTLAYKGNDGTVADCAVNSYVPNFFAAHKFNDRITASVSITAPYGLESKYDKNWQGNAQGIHSYLMTADFNPSVSLKITDWLSVSGGLSAQFAYVKLTQNAPYEKMSGDSWGVGGNIGITIQYADEGRIGFSWRSSVHHEFSGDAHSKSAYAPILGNPDIEAEVDIPHTFTVGVYQRLPDLFDRFAIMADYTYTMWSSFDELKVSGLAAPFSEKEDWKDTSRISLGLHYYPKFDENMTLRLGAAFDESPVKTANRTVRIPCGDRVWFSTGAGYKYGAFTFDAGYSYIMVVGNTDINKGEINGHYYGHIHVISAQITYEF